MAKITKRVLIRGTRDILFCRFNVEAITSQERKVKTGTAGNNPEEWRNGVIVDSTNNRLYLPNNYLFSCIKAGAKYVKVGRGSIMGPVTATLQIITEKAYLNRSMPDEWEKIKTEDFPRADSGADVYLDIRGVKNPNTNGRNIRYRIACRPGWEVSFDFMFDNTIVNEDKMMQAIEDAGNLVGIADGLAIGMGRFEVLESKTL